MMLTKPFIARGLRVYDAQGNFLLEFSPAHVVRRALPELLAALNAATLPAAVDPQAEAERVPLGTEKLRGSG